MIFGINTTRDMIIVSNLRITILKCHSWYLYHLSLLIMLLPILIRILQNQTDLKCQSEDNTCDQEFQLTTRACYINKASAGNRDCVK